jgi:hypothetical protein
MKGYRTSGLRLFILLLFGTVISILLAIGKTNAARVFLGVDTIFLVMALAAWAYTEIRFEGDNIVRTAFFMFRRKQPISSIKRLSFGTDTDSFGGQTTYATIEFNRARPFVLFDFSKNDLREIVQRISATEPNAIDSTVRKHLDDADEGTGGGHALRLGDRFIFTAGAIVVFLAALWWLLQRYWMS